MKTEMKHENKLVSLLTWYKYWIRELKGDEKKTLKRKKMLKRKKDQLVNTIKGKNNSSKES